MGILLIRVKQPLRSFLVSNFPEIHCMWFPWICFIFKRIQSFIKLLPVFICHNIVSIISSAKKVVQSTNGNSEFIVCQLRCCGKYQRVCSSRKLSTMVVWGESSPKDIYSNDNVVHFKFSGYKLHRSFLFFLYMNIYIRLRHSFSLYSMSIFEKRSYKIQ